MYGGVRGWYSDMPLYSITLVFGLMLLPGGLKLAGTYFGMMLWIQLWPPLFAILNLIINASNRDYVKSIMGSTGITMSNINLIAEYGSMASAAAGLGIFIPVISYMIIRGGASQFVHIAGQLSSATQAAAGSSAMEVTSGNRSFDNTSLSSQSYMMQSGFKRDMNSSLRQGHMEYALSDGTIVKETASGKTIMHSGPGVTTSTGSSSFRQSDMISGQVHEQIGYEKSQMDSESKEYSTLEQSMQRKAVDYVARLAQGQASGQNYDYSNSTSKGNNLNEIVGTAKELHEKYGYSWQQSSEMALNGNGGAKLGFGGGGSGGSSKLLSTGNVAADLAAGISGSVSARNIDDQALDESRSNSKRSEYTENTESAIKAAKTMHFNENQSEEKSLADQLTNSYEKMQSLRDSINVHKQNIDRYQHNIDSTKSSSFTSDSDRYQDMQNFIAKQKNQFGYEIGQVRAHQMMEKGGDEFEGLKSQYISREVGKNQYMSQVNKFDRNRLDHQYQERSQDISSKNTINDNDVSLLKQQQIKQMNKSVDDVAKNKYEVRAEVNKSYNEDMKQSAMKKFDKQQKEVDYLENNKRFAKDYVGIKKENADS